MKNSFILKLLVIVSVIAIIALAIKFVPKFEIRDYTNSITELLGGS